MLAKRKTIADYFLEEKNPWSQKRKIDTKKVKVILGVVVFLFIVVVIAMPVDPKKENQDVTTNTTSNVDLNMAQGNSDAIQNEVRRASENSNAFSFYNNSAGGGGSGSSRQFGASQIVKASDSSLGAGGLPMGTTVSAKLLNTLLSSDSVQPVIGEIAEDVLWENSVMIPAGSKAIGQANFDDAAKRLQIRFHTLVYPDGEEHAVSALALLPDGSSGVPGEYHSNEGSKQFGRFIGTFVGGVAEGLKDKQAGGPLGGAIEPGNLKNGLLNGVSASAIDQSKRISEDLQAVKPYLEVPGGSYFLLYFEKGYVP